MKPKRLTPQQLKTQQQLDRISSAFKQAMAAAQYPKAMQEALRAHKLIPQSVAPLSDAATAAVKGSLWHEAIVYAKKALQRQAATSIRSMRWRCLWRLDHRANCRTYGLQALQLRDSQVMAALDAAPPLPACRQTGRANRLSRFHYRQPRRIHRAGGDEHRAGRWRCILAGCAAFMWMAACPSRHCSACAATVPKSCACRPSWKTGRARRGAFWRWMMPKRRG